MTDEAPVNPLSALADAYYQQGDTTRKPISYLLAYQRLLEHRRSAPLRILELGVSSGASLLIWRDYLPRATIVGIDIAEMPACLAEQARIHFLQGSQDDPATLDRAGLIAGGQFDLIIDDASHIGFLTKRALNYLFPRWLAPGGYYVIEDLGTAFMVEYPDGASFTAPAWDDAVSGTAVFEGHQNGMVGVLKQLIDHMMQELSTGTRSYLAIKSIAIESNVAFIEKSRQLGAPVPGPLPQGVAEPGASSASVGVVAERLSVVAERLEEISAELIRQNERIEQVARALGGLLRLVAPLRYVWRLATGRRLPRAE